MLESVLEKERSLNVALHGSTAGGVAGGLVVGDLDGGGAPGGGGGYGGVGGGGESGGLLELLRAVSTVAGRIPDMEGTLCLYPPPRTSTRPFLTSCSFFTLAGTVLRFNELVVTDAFTSLEQLAERCVKCSTLLCHHLPRSLTT